MRKSTHLLAAAAWSFGSAAIPAAAFATPFTFHCRGDACGAVTFLDEGNGCIVVTSHSPRAVHILLGGAYGRTIDLAPGATDAPLRGGICYGYYDGGESVDYVR